MFPRHTLPRLVFMPYMEAAGIEPAQGSPGTWLLHGTHIYEYWWATFVGGNELDKQATRLYAIGEGRKGPVKFGVSSNPEDRLRGLQHANPRKLTLLTHIPSPKGFERTVLAILGAHRIHGEWFRREGDVLAVISLMRDIARVVDDFRRDGMRLDADELYTIFFEDAGARGLLNERTADPYTYFWDRPAPAVSVVPCGQVAT